jgi:hypothetical protein
VPQSDPGTVPRTYSGTVPRTYSGTVPRTYSGTVPHTYSGTVPHTYSGTYSGTDVPPAGRGLSSRKARSWPESTDFSLPARRLLSGRIGPRP